MHRLNIFFLTNVKDFENFESDFGILFITVNIARCPIPRSLQPYSLQYQSCPPLIFPTAVDTRFRYLDRTFSNDIHQLYQILPVLDIDTIHSTSCKTDTKSISSLNILLTFQLSATLFPSYSLETPYIREFIFSFRWAELSEVIDACELHFYAPEIEDRGAYCFCAVCHSVILSFCHSVIL